MKIPTTDEIRQAGSHAVAASLVKKGIPADTIPENVRLLLESAFMDGAIYVLEVIKKAEGGSR